ncbi:MAG: PhoPQ-activated protein PqaA family protein [Candidatus Hydrogenedentes bacterium]|nr:PhoPQ-activated protein PqaA family protein [Candidatus Hydrogenedentota bacterium]
MRRALQVSLVVLLVTMFAVAADAAKLTITVTGQGTTYRAPGTYSCGFGEEVWIWAIPAEGWKFDHWSGGMSGCLNSDKIVMWLFNKTATANFVQLPPLSPNTALKHFMAKADTNYVWNNYQTTYSFGYTTYFEDMVSQQWRTAQEVDRPIWQHYVIIQVGWFAGDTAIMLIDGGSNGGTPPSEPDSTIGYMSLLTGFPVADLKQCPNQPLYFTDEPGVSRSEDDILAYSFDKYMVTGDYTWNGHLPMAKAALRGMDTIQHQLGTTKFLVAGASKRGWATWLTAATDDPRIIGFVPIVIPILNVEAQMDHHWESYGFYAPAVDPYSAFDLFCRIKCPTGVDWMEIEDPYRYFGESTTVSNKPKCLVNASGDQFFCTDSLRFYWNDIPGPGTKHVRIIPNTSHGMEEPGAYDAALATAIAWGKKVKNGAAQPVYSWVVNGDNSITVTCGSQPSGGAKLWQATNPTARDFRYELIGAAWTSTTLPGTTSFTGYCPPPAQGWTAYFVEVDFGNDEVYTSEIVIAPDILPFAGTHCL